MKNSGCIRFLLHLGFLMVLPAVSMGDPPPPSNSAIPSYQAFTPIDYQQISKELDAQGEPYMNEYGDQVQLSDFHDLVYAEFRVNPDLSDIGEGIEIVAPRLLDKSYLAPPPALYRYYFDEVVLNGLAR